MIVHNDLHDMYSSENNVQNETWVVFTGGVTVVITLEIKIILPNHEEDMGRSTRNFLSRGNFSKTATLPRCVSLEQRAL